jgi:hypothetical protein
VFELLVTLHPVLGGQLAQLVDVLRLEVGQAEGRLVRVGREGTGVDRRVLPRGVVVATLIGRARLLAARATVLAAAGPPASLGASLFAQECLDCRMCRSCM